MSCREVDAWLFGETAEMRRRNRAFVLVAIPLVVFATVGEWTLRKLRVPFLEWGRPCR